MVRGVAGSEVGSHRLSKYSASCKSIVFPFHNVVALP